MHHHLAQKRWRLWVAATSTAIMVLIVLISIGITWGQTEPAPVVSGPNADDVHKVLNPSIAFPETVAIVNGEPVTGRRLAQRVEILRLEYKDNPLATPPEPELTQTALDQLILFEVLVQAGKAEGLAPTEGEAQAYILSTKQKILALPLDSPVRQGAESLAAAVGYDLATAESSPILIDQARRTLIAIKMRQKIVGGLPEADKARFEAQRGAVRAFVESYKSAGAVEILLPVGSP